jgi:hypothetical protein
MTSKQAQTTRAGGPQTCGKVMFLSEKAAITHAVKVGKVHGHQQRVYQCGFCGHWHLTTRR